ncbi:protein SprT [Lactococcus hodotermopsidis]|uniref:Protein SprT n=1 Tax=Pseudolactococcus hodotermopsidis TaxID=2709157 RepID=A0A6A0BCI2_9LACT|nr:SprT family protein [Lactococcus hodotermopsidis]GFH42134.1 protein SprT [Lactococcus hodotermopsidis]
MTSKDDQLLAFVKWVSETDFGQPFEHEVRFNGRLRSTGGRFFPKDLHLDFNEKMYDQFSEDVFRQIVQHELVHYHLYRAGRGYKHADSDFKNLLAQVGGLRFAPTLPDSQHLTYVCQTCGQIYLRRRKLAVDNYRCGNCHGKLALERNHCEKI